MAKGRESAVVVACHETRDCQGRLPKPVMDRLGRPSHLAYRIARGKMG